MVVVNAQQIHCQSFFGEQASTFRKRRRVESAPHRHQGTRRRRMLATRVERGEVRRDSPHSINNLVALCFPPQTLPSWTHSSNLLDRQTIVKKVFKTFWCGNRSCLALDVGRDFTATLPHTLFGPDSQLLCPASFLRGLGRNTHRFLAWSSRTLILWLLISYNHEVCLSVSE